METTVFFNYGIILTKILPGISKILVPFALNQNQLVSMNTILIFGAGRSSGALIRYLLEVADANGWEVVVADAALQSALDKISNHPAGTAIALDVMDEEKRRALIEKASVVVSLLPAFLHAEVATDCLSLGRNLVTASYVSQELRLHEQEVQQKGLVFMNEIGLDPGIDHMSAMQIIHRLKERGSRILAFRSYAGGLIAPESDTNPWHYKFTWNPRNVVLAGQGTAQFLRHGRLHFVPYHRLFGSFEPIAVPGLGDFEVYPNRDSLLYIEKYGLQGIPEIVRGTIRGQGYCAGWDALVRLGLTDASYPLSHSHQLTYRSLLEGLTASMPGDNLEKKVSTFLGVSPESELMHQLAWLGLFEEKLIPVKNGTPAAILEDLLLRKWNLEPDDKDMIVMQHEFDYEEEGQQKRLLSTMILKGTDSANTAMAKLVGLPLGIFVKNLLLGHVNETGVLIPATPAIYEPILSELENFGITFIEEETVL